MRSFFKIKNKSVVEYIVMLSVIGVIIVFLFPALQKNMQAHIRQTVASIESAAPESASRPALPVPQAEAPKEKPTAPTPALERASSREPVGMKQVALIFGSTKSSETFCPRSEAPLSGRRNKKGGFSPPFF